MVYSRKYINISCIVNIYINNKLDVDFKYIKRRNIYY